MEPKLYRTRAPLRLGLAGGGTDVSPYSEEYGGCVLNATINMYAHCTLELLAKNEISFTASDINCTWSGELVEHIPIEGDLILHKAVYNRVVKDFNNGKAIPVSVTTYSDAPPGSGLGSSSTMVVSILSAFVELLKLPLGEYDIAHLAYEIERSDCQLSGGKQDQYAATFGGFNFMEFNSGDHVIVNPLRIKNSIIHELEAHLLLYFTGVSRESAKIIDDQSHVIAKNKSSALEGMHNVKAGACKMKEALLRGDINQMSNVLADSWLAKKQTSKAISNPHVENIYNTAISAGAKSAKLSGAGGGGFMMLLVEPTKKVAVSAALDSLDNEGGKTFNINFANDGVFGWRV